MNSLTSKADMHVHSKYSKRPSEWILRKIGCAESYTDPLALYRIAKSKGMDFVTITDHNTIAGGLEIAHLKNTFLSEEITTYFPEDHCKLHVLAYGITEIQHDEISRLRQNIYELVGYLDGEGIFHALAHPLFSINDKLTPEHFEQLLILFKVFEVNGSRDDQQNQTLEFILRNLTETDLRMLSDKHRIQSPDTQHWKKILIGGSDDHSSLYIASIYTEMKHVSSSDDFLKGIAENKGLVKGRASNPKILAHNIYSIAYQFYKSKFHLDRFVSRELLLKFVDRALNASPKSEYGLTERIWRVFGYRSPNHFFKSTPKTMQGLLQKEAREIIINSPEINSLIKNPQNRSEDMERAWFLFVDRISERILQQFADSILDSLSGANLFDIFHTMGSAGSLYTMLAPYFVAFSLFTKDRETCRICLESLRQDDKRPNQKTLNLAHFTDTFYDVNGVALTLQMQVELALKNKKRQTIITCGPESNREGVINFVPIGTFEMPEYNHLKIYYPPLLKMVDYCYEQEFTHIHSATPGPIGLAALAISRILKLPIYSTYHTALPQYASHLTEDSAMEELMWKYTLWYYNQMDVIYVPSRATGDELAAKGIDKNRIRFYERGIDIERFHPSKRNGFLRNHFHIEDDDLKLLYVGRVSKEKDMPFLVNVFRKLLKEGPGIHLVVVGDGPYLDDMKEALKNCPVTFTGFLDGDDLSQAYASSDVFVFPSTTDTFGNVVLEAQASGLPVIVTDVGGPKENMKHGTTGVVVPAGNADAFKDAVLKLIRNPSQLQSLGTNARKYMETRSLEASYLQLWESYRTSPSHPFSS